MIQAHGEPGPAGASDNETALSPLARALGVSRAGILHVDDLGMCHAGNQAFLHLAQRGLVTCGSMMVPCPWFPEIAAAGAADPSLDLGVHLTLTSEWAGYRWRPISTSSRASGLIDPDGVRQGSLARPNSFDARTSRAAVIARRRRPAGRSGRTGG